MDEPEDNRASREHFLSVLNSITYTALETQNFDDLVQLLADRLAEIIDADGCYLTLWDEEKQQAIPAAAYGLLRDRYKSIVPEPGEPTITEHVLSLGKSLVIEDAWNSEFASTKISRQLPSKSMLAVPITHGDRKIGAALIAYNEHHEFTQTEIKWCEQAVGQVSLAMINQMSMDALKVSQEAVEHTAAHLDEAQLQAQMGSWEYFPEDDKHIWSKGLFRLLGIAENDPRKPSLKTLLECVVPEDRQKLRNTLLAASAGDSELLLDFKTLQQRHITGRIFRQETSGELMGTAHDVTEQRRLESDLNQARKMEAVGTLAGGIAHNFNNILTVIMGNYEIIKSALQPDSSEVKVLNQCLEAAERAALLTRQLLVVSRKHDLKPTNIDANVLISDLVNLLTPLIGDHIALTTTLFTGLRKVYADKGQLEQVIMNLTLNARDALENGGKLNIDTQNVVRDGENWIAFSVADNGPGIDKHVLPHIFDAFFTTKDEGQGTGLGLATVASIIEQSNGEINVESTVNQGTKFTVLLPESDTQQTKLASDLPTDGPIGSLTRNCRILLVEDHESLRNVAKFTLEKAGYEVVEADTGHKALSLSQQHTIDLVLSDVQLAGGMSGPELVSQLSPEIPIVYMSGLRDTLPENHGANFLPKPFRPHELVAMVESVLLNKP